MDKLWKKISGLFFASLMAVTLTGKANADSEESAALPEPAPTAAVEPAAVQAAPAAAAEAPKPAAETAPVVEAAAPVTEAAPAAEAPAPAAAEEPGPAAAEAVPQEEKPAPAEAEEPSPAPAAEAAVFEAENVPAAEEEAVLLVGEGTVPEAEEAAPEAEEEADSEDAEKEPGEAADAASPAAASESLSADAAMGSASGGLRGGSGEEETEDETYGLVDSEFKGEEPEELNLVLEPEPRAVSSGKDITIKTAGLKHITSLNCGGDVSIIGTGILLVDEVVLQDDCGVYLQSFEEIYGPDGGTVALFVLTGEQDGMKTYTLVNGVGSDGSTVLPAVLDEEYVIPEGVTLVVPEGGSLLMQGLQVLVETQGGETLVQYSTEQKPSPTLTGDGATQEYISTAPSLTISRGASVVVNRGGHIRLEMAGGLTLLTQNEPRINVQGVITLYDDVEGGAIVIADTGDVRGTGYFVDPSSITVEEGGSSPITAINAATTSIFVNGAGRDIGVINTRGNSVLRYDSPFSVDMIRVDSGSLWITNTYLRGTETLTVHQSVSGANGGQIHLESGELLLPSAGACSIPIVDDYSDHQGTQWFYLGYASAADGGTLRYSGSSLKPAPLIPLKGTAETVDGCRSIPVADGLLKDHNHVKYYGACSEFSGVKRAVDEDGHPLSFSCPADAPIDYAALAYDLGAYSPAPAGFTGEVPIAYLVETCVDGVYGYVLLESDRFQTVNAADVVQICRMANYWISDPMGGATTTATNTSYTGSGVLGGSGAGSVAGGPRRLALGGSRNTEEEPEPEPEPEQPAAELRVWAEEAEGGCCLLQVQRGGKALTRLAAPVTVRMAFTLPDGMAGKPLYAVFRDADGTLKAFEAYYDPETGRLYFDSDLAGRFVIAAFDFDGEPFSEEFYEALAALDAVMALF